ncbi:hypothetical protein BRD11_00915, partial [Halobacteriales archaeon SW_12_69_24]
VVHTPFTLDDGTGRVLVEPHDDATFDLDPADRGVNSRRAGRSGRAMDRKGLGAIGVLLLVGGFLVVMGVVPTVSHNIAVQENQPTEATVQSTSVDVKTDADGDKSYRPVVTYEYTVDGETYTNDNVFPGGFTRWDGSRGWAERVAGQYEQGDVVTVQYRPGQPGHAYLRNDGWPDAWWIGAVAILVLLGGGAGLVKTGFTRRKQRTLMRDTPTEDVESIAVGPSEVKGSALAADGDPFPAPFSNDECVVADYEVEQYHEDDDGGHWNTVASGVVHTPFTLDDGTGRVLVEPHDDATFDLDPADRATAGTTRPSSGTKRASTCSAPHSHGAETTEAGATRNSSSSGGSPTTTASTTRCFSSPTTPRRGS